MIGWFVSGTDTGVGKTVLAAALVRLLRGRGVDVGAFKPVATGVPPDGDANLLHAAAGGVDDLSLVSPVRFRQPLAPAVAAEEEGLPPGLDGMRAAYATLRGRHDVLVVEGAGGLRVPLAFPPAPGTASFEVADLAAEFGLPLVVAARAGLGTVNHVLLTLEAAERRGLAVAAVVLNHGAAVATDPSVASNAATLGCLVATPILGPLPSLTGAEAADPDRLADAFAPFLAPLLDGDRHASR